MLFQVDGRKVKKEEKMSEMMKEFEEMITAVYEAMQSKKLADAIATAYWNIFTAMTTKGFTTKEALSILSHMKFGQS